MEQRTGLQANPEFIYRRIAGEHLLVPVGRAAEAMMGMASLNETGKFLWDQLQQPISVEDLERRFAAEYELTPEESHRDVSDFLAMAQKRNAVISV